MPLRLLIPMNTPPVWSAKAGSHCRSDLEDIDLMACPTATTSLVAPEATSMFLSALALGGDAAIGSSGASLFGDGVGVATPRRPGTTALPCSSVGNATPGLKQLIATQAAYEAANSSSSAQFPEFSWTSAGMSKPTAVNTSSASADDDMVVQPRTFTPGGMSTDVAATTIDSISTSLSLDSQFDNAVTMGPTYRHLVDANLDCAMPSDIFPVGPSPALPSWCPPPSMWYPAPMPPDNAESDELDDASIAMLVSTLTTDMNSDQFGGQVGDLGGDLDPLQLPVQGNHDPRTSTTQSDIKEPSTSADTLSGSCTSASTSGSSSPCSSVRSRQSDSSYATSTSSSVLSSGGQQTRTRKSKPRPKRIRRLCVITNCGKRSRSQGLCIAHGGGKRCIVEGCDKSSQGGDLCIRHGGGKRCRIPGCDKAAQTNLLCKAHGGGPRCQFEDCDKSSQGGGFCRMHGGGKRCLAPGCLKGTQRGEFCAQHGGSRLCEVDGCMRNDRGGGFCAYHGGGKRCSVAGCSKPCRRGGVCSSHLRALEADRSTEWNS